MSYTVIPHAKGVRFEVQRSEVLLSDQEKRAYIKRQGWIPNLYKYNIKDLKTGLFLDKGKIPHTWTQQEPVFPVAYTLDSLKGILNTIYLYLD